MIKYIEIFDKEEGLYRERYNFAISVDRSKFVLNSFEKQVRESRRHKWRCQLKSSYPREQKYNRFSRHNGIEPEDIEVSQEIKDRVINIYIEHIKGFKFDIEY